MSYNSSAALSLDFEDQFFNDGVILPLNRKQRKKTAKAAKQPSIIKANTGLTLKPIAAITDTQQRVFNSFNTGQNMFLHGVAGTGKTFLSMYLALNQVLNQHTYQSVTIIRSTVSSRDMGFLPGNQKEKQRVYEQPYQQICNELFGRGDAYECLKNRKAVDFISTSFIRGTTLRDTIVIVDECQNMTDNELHTIITRVGDNCRIIFAGDFNQTDLKIHESGILKFMKIINTMRSMELIEFQVEDIVRSGLVKEYIIARYNLERYEASSRT